MSSLQYFFFGQESSQVHACAFTLIDEQWMTHATKSWDSHYSYPFKYICRRIQGMINLTKPHFSCFLPEEKILQQKLFQLEIEVNFTTTYQPWKPPFSNMYLEFQFAQQHSYLRGLQLDTYLIFLANTIFHLINMGLLHANRVRLSLSSLSIKQLI